MRDEAEVKEKKTKESSERTGARNKAGCTQKLVVYRNNCPAFARRQVGTKDRGPMILAYLVTVIVWADAFV